MHRLLLIIIFLTIPAREAFASSETFKIAIMPYEISGDHDWKSFKKKLTKSLSKVDKAGKVDLIVMPELLSFDFLSNAGEKNLQDKLRKSAAYFPQIKNAFIKKAKTKNVNIMAGSFHRLQNDNLYNTSLFVSRSGQVVLQDKIYITPWERKYNFKNGTELLGFSIDGISTVILNCHDVEFPDLSRLLSAYSPELIIVPSMTDDEHGYQRVLRTSKARAIEHMAFVAMVGTIGGEAANWHTYYSRAGLITPQNATLAKHEVYGEENSAEPLIIELNFAQLRAEREKKSNIYPLRDKRQRKESLDFKML